MIFFSLQGIKTSLETLLLLNIVIFLKRDVPPVQLFIDKIIYKSHL